MSQAVNLAGNTVIHGSGLTEGKYLPCAGVSGRSISLNLHSQTVWPLRCASVRATFVCRASSNNGNYRRHPDYPRHSNKQGFSRGGRNNRNQNDERERDKDGLENLDDSDIVSSKNGPYVSLSNSPKFQATAAPGPREKEIVELFRKVQAQLRERAASREDKRSESSSQGQGKDNETVDSLLKLLRKHSTEQTKRKDNSYDQNSQQGQNGQYIRGKIMGSINSNNGVTRSPSQDSISVPISPSSARPASSFQRRSPIPETNSRSAYPDEEETRSFAGKGKAKHVEDIPEDNLALGFDDDHEDDSESELEVDEPELVQLLESDLSSAEEAIILDEIEEEESDEEEEEEEELTEPEDLSVWKLTELRALAKSRGFRGYSKMKKSELVGLLNGTSV